MMTSPQAREAFDLSKEPPAGPRALRHEPLRPVLPAGPAADRGGRAVRHGQHVSDRVRRDHLGHSRLEAVHVDRRHAQHRGADVRPGLQRAVRGPEPARHARQDAGLQPGRVRPHAAREPGRRPRSLAAMLDRATSPAAACRAAASSAAATRSAACRPSGPSSRPKSWPRSTTASGSIWKRSCPARKAGPFPLVDSGKHEIKELF